MTSKSAGLKVRIEFDSVQRGHIVLEKDVASGVGFKDLLQDLAAEDTPKGFFGAYLKSSGFDEIVIHRSAKRWVYLYIYDGIVEIPI